MHLILVGDSVFDNGNYVDQGQAVGDHLKRCLPKNVMLTSLAIDGHFSAHVHHQLDRLPATASHIALSAGGNDALAVLHLLETPCASISDALKHLSQFQRKFEIDYLRLKRRLEDLGLPLLVCTIYDAVPDLPVHLKAGLSLFNDVITRSIHHDRNDCLDLRECLKEDIDFSEESPIEPSSIGGKKIAELISRWVCSYDTNATQNLYKQVE